MLKTNLSHVATEEELKKVIENNENVMICCGRMGPMCTPVYSIMERLQPKYPHVVFRDMEFDIPAASFIQNLPECRSFLGLPFTVYFKNGSVVSATSSIQTENDITRILTNEFGRSSN